MLIYLITRTVISNVILRRGKGLKNTHIYKGFKFYFDTPRNQRKNIFRVLYELEKLSWYWRVFPSSYFMFHMHLKSFTDYSRMKSFIPQRAYSKFARGTDYDILINDKILFHEIMSTHDIPVPKRYFFFRNNSFYRGSHSLSHKEVDQILSEISDEKLFVKRHRGGKGKGVFMYQKRNNGYYNKEGDRLSAQYVLEKYNDQTIFFEQGIKQHPVLDKFNPDSVNTIRVQVIKDKKGNDQIIAAATRFGMAGKHIDNASQGGIVVSVDVKHGLLSDYGSRYYKMETFTHHPDTKTSFRGTVIPHWNKTKSLIYKIIKILPYYNGIGIDIAIRKEGPVVVEINTGADAHLVQIGKETGIASKFK